MNELDDLMGAESSPVELSELIGTPLPTAPLPQAAMRNRAATLSLLADGADNPEKLAENYQTMLAEGEAGSNSYTKSVEENVKEQITNQDKETFMSVLADPSVPFERKKQLVEDMRVNGVHKDTHTTLFTKTLAEESSGESPEAEDARIGSMSNAINEIYQANEEIQGLVNAHALTLQDVGVGTAVDMAELWVMPFGNSVAVSDLDPAKQSVWGLIKGFLLPGSKVANIRDQLEALPPEQRVDFAKSLINTISTNSGIVFSNDNQFAQYEKAVQIFDQGGYSGVEEFLDNISVLLDVVGLGGLVRVTKGVKTLSKGPASVSNLHTVPQVSKGSVLPSQAPVSKTAGVGQEDLAKVTGKPTAGAYDGRIADLENEKARLLGQTGGELGRGEVRALTEERKQITQTFNDLGTEQALAKDIQRTEGITSKAAKAKAKEIYAERYSDYEAKLARIDNQIERNKAGSQITQRVAKIEKDIEMLQKRNTPVYLQKTPLADAISRIELNSVVRLENPSAPHSIIKLTNPQRARNNHEALIVSVDDVAAEALTGVKRNQAIANDVFPQVGTPSGAVLSQPTDIQRNLRRKELVPEHIREYIWSSGRIDLTPQEKAAVRANVVRDFQSAEGLVMNEAMGSFTLDGGRIKISATYGTPEGSFASAKEARDQAMYALRKMGIREDEVEVLERKGRDFVPVNVDEAVGEGAYMVRINTYHEIDPSDIAKFEEFKVKLNFADRFSALNWGSSGSMARHLLDAASMLDKRITGAASNIADQGAKLEQMMLEEAKIYSDKFSKLDKTQKAMVEKYLVEANLNGLAFDPVDLMARGFDMNAVDAVRSWREFWDVNYYLENFDMVRTLNAQGFQYFKNKNAELFARPVAKNQSNNKVYDPDIDQVVLINKQDMDDLYDLGGTVAKLRRPTDFGGDTAEYMLVRNSPTSYVRKIRDSDTVLNYREGYYAIQYKAPRFVDEVAADGTRRAIAVAGDTLEAQHFATRMARNATKGETYVVRSDDRAMRKGSDDWFDLNSARGRIAQRHRGKTLEDSSGMNHLGDGSYIEDPVSSAIKAAKSISGRTVARPMLETAKARFMQQYAKYLPSDGMGGVRFPSSVEEMGAKGESYSSAIADARTTWEYIRYLENGYINSVDNFFKSFLHMLSETTGNVSVKTGMKSLGKLERGFDYLSELSPTGLGKNLVFNAYIGTNVLRQWIVQSHQATRTWAYNPKGWITGKIPDYMASYVNYKMNDVFGLPNVPRQQTKEFVKFIDDSGMMAAVDKQNLVRGTLKDASDHSNLLIKGSAKALNVPRQIGFDMGERANMLGHLAATYDKYVSAGKDMSLKAVRDEAYSEARALSYDMNFAGDMPYNQNAAGMLLQFMQVPHKAMAQLTNQRLPVSMRMRLIAADMMFWGPPSLLVSSVMGGDILPEDPKLREAITFGMESMLLNEMFRKLAKDDDINIDFSSLAPYDMTGWGEFFMAMYEGGFSQALLNSPSGQLLKSDGKVQNAIKSMARAFSFQEPIEETPDTFFDVLNETLSISSGYSNGMKAYLALKTGQRYNKYGSLIDNDTHPIEAYAEAFGFSDASQRDLYYASKKSSESVKSHKEEVTQDVKVILDYVAKRMVGTDPREVELIQRTTAIALSRYADDPVAQEIFRQQLMFKLRDPNEGLLYNLLKASGLPESGELKDTIRMSSLPEEQKQQLIKRIEDINNLKEGN